MALEIRPGLCDLELLRDAAQEIRHAPEAQAAAAPAVRDAVVAEVLPVDACLHRMTAADVEELIGELIQILAERLRVGAIRSDVGNARDVQLAEHLARHKRDVGARVERVDVLAWVRPVEPAAQLVDER